MKRLITTLTVALLCFGTGASLSHAQVMDASPPATVDAGIDQADAAPMPDAAESGSQASGVSGENGEAETEQGEDQGDKGAAELGSDLYGAIKAGAWMSALGFALLLLVSIARKFGGKWAKTKLGGYVLGFGVPLLSVLGLSLTTGQWSPEAFLGALTLGLTASGLQRGAKHIKTAKDARAPS